MDSPSDEVLERLVDELLEAGIEPMATLEHAPGISHTPSALTAAHLPWKRCGGFQGPLADIVEFYLRQAQRGIGALSKAVV